MYVDISCSGGSSSSDVDEGYSDEVRKLMEKTAAVRDGNEFVHSSSDACSEKLQMAAGERCSSTTAPWVVRGSSLPPTTSAISASNQSEPRVLPNRCTGNLAGETITVGFSPEACADNPQPTMWIGTEDGTIHVYNCNDNIRIKKNKIKIQQESPVKSIVYVFICYSHRCDLACYAMLSNSRTAL